MKQDHVRSLFNQNLIAHDYAGANAAEIFAYCRQQKPVFDAICGLLSSYVTREVN